jgi:hypothetical protein
VDETTGEEIHSLTKAQAHEVARRGGVVVRVYILDKEHDYYVGEALHHHDCSAAIVRSLVAAIIRGWEDHCRSRGNPHPGE